MGDGALLARLRCAQCGCTMGYEMKLKPLKCKFNDGITPKSPDKIGYEPKQNQRPRQHATYRRKTGAKMIGEVCILLFIFTSVCFAGPMFRVDKKIQYRLFFGEGKYDFVDVYGENCDVIGKELECEFKDYSAIDRVEIKDDYLMIFKRRSVWFLYNYNDPSKMILKYAGERYLYES